MISLKGVSKSFKNLEIFKDINVEFPTGKKIMIKGINGSGKSVLLKMIVGYSIPTSGKVIIDDVELRKQQDFIPNAGVSINAPEFCEHMTGKENLLALLKNKNKMEEHYIYQLAKFLNLEKDLNKKYKNYSLGMKQKLRLIQALMENPKYLILDEPFDSLDEQSQKKTVELLKKFMSNDKTIVYTSHNCLYDDFADYVYEIIDCKLIKKQNKKNK